MKPYDVIKEHEEMLKPCPFCGGKPRIRTILDIDYDTHYVIECRKCEVKPRVSNINIKEVVKTWNKRGKAE